ncbi:MAG: hypothetical protein ABH851_04965 [Methanobacteriota archaeon]
MIKITADEIARWRNEIDNAEEFRDKELGELKYQTLTGAGENIDYFEAGISGRLLNDYNINLPLQTINIIFPIVKNIIPTLYWKNPHLTSIPKRQEDEDSAPYSAAILNHYYEELDIKSVNRQVIFDAYVIGMGVCKIGYATQFGSDMPDEGLEKRREKEKKQGLLEKLGLKKPKPEEPKENVDLNEYIKAENPYVCWVNPFEFGIDPCARNIHEARYVYQRITKLLKQVKSNPNYSNTDKLVGSPVSESLSKDIPETQIENFETIDLYEIHYKTDEGINILVLAKDQDTYKPLYHDKSIYEMDGFQFEVLAFNKHNHKLYAKSDINIVKGLQDRIATTFDSILDQVDKYVPKIFVDETAMTEPGKRALRDGDIGSICYTNKDPNVVVKEASFTQLKADLSILIDKIMEVVMLETGLTKAQLMGMTSAQTATEAQIGQAGQNLRLSDKFDLVSDFANKQADKLWAVIRQFVDLEEIQLITGERGIDEVTGLPKFSWMPDINSSIADNLKEGDYRFHIEVGSTEKPDLPILRKQVENLGNILMKPEVLVAFQQQGYKINIAEILKRYLMLFPDVFADTGKIIQPITQNTQGLIPQAPPQGPGGGGTGVRPQQFQESPPNTADIISQIGGEKGGMPLA